MKNNPRKSKARPKARNMMDTSTICVKGIVIAARWSALTSPVEEKGSQHHLAVPKTTSWQTRRSWTRCRFLPSVPLRKHTLWMTAHSLLHR